MPVSKRGTRHVTGQPKRCQMQTRSLATMGPDRMPWPSIRAKRRGKTNITSEIKHLSLFCRKVSAFG